MSLKTLSSSIIKIDDKKNKIIDGVLHTRAVEDEELRIPLSNLVSRFEAPSFIYKGKKYIVDDGHQDIMVKCGYIIMNDYDVNRIDDPDIGIDCRQKILSAIKSAIDTISGGEAINNSVSTKFESCGYVFHVYFNTINNIVNRNEKRLSSELCVYPFNKQMDKYGTIYFRIFAAKSANNKNISKYIVANDFINLLVDKLNKEDSNNSYKYITLPTKKRIYNWSDEGY